MSCCLSAFVVSSNYTDGCIFVNLSSYGGELMVMVTSYFLCYLHSSVDKQAAVLQMICL